MIYLDNAATTIRKPDTVARRVFEVINNLGNSARGCYDASMESSRVIYDTREKISDLFGGFGPTSVAFTMNSTMSLNMAIKGIVSPNDHVITTNIEHNSVLRPLYQLEREGIKLSIVECDDKGCIFPEDIEKEITKDTKAIVISHMSNLTGNITDINAVGLIARKYDLVLIVDASQSAGVMDINMKEDNIDVLCFTGHKSLFGPQGTGGLCVNPRVTIRPLVTGGTGIKTFDRNQPVLMPTALEAGTLNSHGIAGLGAGIEFISDIGIDKIREHELSLSRMFYNEVRKLPTIKLYGDYENINHGPIVSINIGVYDSAMVGDELYRRFGIITRSGGHCAPLMHKFFNTQEQGMVRFSFGYFNNVEEVEIAVKSISILINE